MSRGTINEQYLDDIAVAINAKLGSSSTMTPSEMASKISSIPTSSGAVLGHGSFSANGSYSALDDNLDGYSTVDVSIPMAILSASNNGTYTPSVGGYNQVNVSVPLSSITISVNGSYSAAQGGYNDITVDVPQPTMSTLSVNVNGSYTAPSGYAYDQVDVDVPQATMSTLSVSANGSYAADPNTGFDVVNVDVPSAALSSKTITVNGVYNAIDDSLDGYDTVTVSVPGGATLGSKTITVNGIYNAIDDSLDGYDTVTVSVKTDVGTYDWYSDGIDVSVTVDDVNLSGPTATNSFYETYSSIPINTLTINVGTSTSLSYFNSNPTNSVRFKKLILGSGVTRTTDFTYSQFYCVREIEIQNTASFSGAYCRNNQFLVKAGYSSSARGITYFQSQFGDCRSLESLQLPVSITVIPQGFCQGDYNLKEINLNELENLTEIKYGAFGSCLKIKDIDFSNLSNLTTIGNSAFSQTGVSEVKSSYLTSVGGFTYCYDLTTIDLPNVSYLETGTFASCTNLTSITLSPVLSSIPNYCFQYCYNLQNVDFSNLSSCTELGYAAFGACAKLTEVILPSAITTLDSSCFQYCYNLTSINLDNVITLGSSCFNYCSNLTSVNLSNAITLGTSCFQKCSNLISVNLDNVTAIGDNAFSYDANLTTVTLNNSLSTLGVACFASCSNLTSINLDNITTIGSSCFQNCTNLSSVNIENATTIYPNAFDNCGALTSVTLNTTLSSIPASGFRYTGISSVEIPSAVTLIGSSAFSGAPLNTFIFYDTNTVTVSTNALPFTMSSIYYRGSPGKTASDLETEYLSRYNSVTALKPSANKTIYYVPYEDWNV